MDNKLSEKIAADFPLLFDYRKDELMLPFPMFGFEVESGWFPIIYSACKTLDHCRSELDIRIRVDQIKEKFGTLRFYTTGEPKEGEYAIQEAMRLSAEICEYCGHPGKLRTNGWYSTLCEDHYADNKVNLKPIIDEMLLAVHTK